ncbi:hypothetical protein K1719_013733 [Acacia pycnantha]|nr:hypothetical protein K1719_013733 [Acacia pycnantha]
MEYLERRLSALKPSHVYISFDDDDDTRKFVRSLSAALKAQGFTIFGHHEKRETGASNNIPYYQLLEAIEKSWIWIAVFSKNYASSFWCLRELEEFAGCRDWRFCRSVRALDSMVEERETRFEADIDKVNRWRRALKDGFHLSGRRRSVGERSIAVYYDVDPNSFPQQAYLEHSAEERQRRLEAVKQVTVRSGWPVPNYSSGTQVIQKIVKEVKSRIDQQFYDFFGFVGIQSQVEEVEKLLDLSTDDEVQVVGICGMAGLGKSTIGAVLYLKIFHCFDAFCFLPNVSERLRQGDLSLPEFLRRNLEAQNSEEYPTEDFKEMIDRVLDYADGLPLAIEMLGSSFYGKGIAEWRSFLDREEIIPPDEIIMVLRKSFDELDDMTKEMFLDVACFFVGKDINYVKEVLHDCISCCVDKESNCLFENQLSQLQIRGYKCMACCKQWDEKLFDEKVQISLNYDVDYTFIVTSNMLWRKKETRLLIFRNVKCFGTLVNLSSELRYVSWHQYPFTGLPSRFRSDTLVQLIMPESNMTEVWKGRMILPKLRKMNLCGSKTLTKTPDFGGVPNLERLELEGRTGLLQLD